MENPQQQSVLDCTSVNESTTRTKTDQVQVVNVLKSENGGLGLIKRKSKGQNGKP